MDAGDSGPLKERGSTSLWTTRDGVSDEMYTSSFDGADRPPLNEYGVNNHPPSRTPCFQIQLVKKRDRRESQPFYEVTIAGMRSKGVESTEDPGVVEHTLCTHHGWQKDELTKQYVVSPCVLSVFVEDGERAPQRCELSVYLQRPFSDVRNKIFLGHRDVPSFSAQSDIYSPLVTVYPCHYAPPMRVSFYDYGRVYQFEADRNRKNSIPFANTIAQMGLGQLLRQYNYEPSSNSSWGKLLEEVFKKAQAPVISYLFGTAGTTAILSTTLAGGLAMVSSLMAFPLIGAGLYAVVSTARDLTTEEFSDEGNIVHQKLKGLGLAFDIVASKAIGDAMAASSAGAEAGAAAADPSFSFVDEATQRLNDLFGFRDPSKAPPRPPPSAPPSENSTGENSTDSWTDSFSAAATAAGGFMYNVAFDPIEGDPIEGAMAPSPPPPDDRPDGYTSDQVRKILGASVSSFGRTLQTYMNRQPGPEPVRISFTLEEFATSLEVLAATTSNVTNVRPTAQDTKIFHVKFRRQLILWQWLQDPERTTSVFTRAVQSTGEGFGRRVNPLDMSECKTDREFSTKILLEIVVEDPDICNQTHNKRHRFFTERPDGAILGAISSNELERIERVNKAIEKLEGSLRDAAERTKGRMKMMTGAIARHLSKIPVVGMAIPTMASLLETIFNTAYFAVTAPFYEQIITFPILRSILGKANSLNGQQRAREVASLLNASYSIYSRVLKNLPLKLKRHFNSDMYNGSPIGTFKLQSKTSLTTSLARCPPRPQAAAAAPPTRTPTSPPDRMTVDAFFQTIKDISTAVNFYTNTVQLTPPSGSVKAPQMRRHLPQSATNFRQSATNFRLFFPKAPASNLDSVDFTDQFMTTREVSKIHDAMLEYNSYCSGAVPAFQNLLREWFKTNSRPFGIVHYHAHTEELKKALKNKPVQAVIDSFALQLNPPSDVFALLSQPLGTEATQRRIQAIMGPKTQLYHGIPGTWQHVLALRFYAEIATTELMKRHRQPDWQKASFSVRRIVDSIAIECADFVLKACSDDRILSFSWLDPATFATETRKYTQLLVSRVHANDSVLNGTVSSLEQVAYALKDISRLKTLNWQTIAVEQLASLRMSYQHGTVAFDRLSNLISGNQNATEDHALALCVASYPVLMMDREIPLNPPDDRWKQFGDDPILATGATMPSIDDVKRITDDELSRLKYRFESLRVDFDQGGADGIERRIARLSVSNAIEHGRFFVPSTYGDHLPPLYHRHVPALLFSSTPVSKEAAVLSIQRAISVIEQSAVPPPDQSVELVPSFSRCRSTEESYVIDIPSEIVYDPDECIRFLGSYVNDYDTTDTFEGDVTSAEDAARSAVLTTSSDSLSDTYSSIAWNAERILQSLILARCNEKRFFNVTMPSNGVRAFDAPSTVRLRERRDAFLQEIKYHTKVCIDAIRLELATVAKQANALFIQKVEEQRAFLIGLGGTGAIADASDQVLASHDESNDGNYKPLSIGVDFQVTDATTPTELFLNADQLTEAAMLENDLPKKIFDISRQFLRDLFANRVDFRVVVRDMGSEQLIENWIFRPQRLFGINVGLGSDIDRETFTFRAGDTTDVQLDDLSDDQKTELLNGTFILNAQSALRLESPFRMVEYLYDRVLEIDRRLKGINTDGRDSENVHSKEFRKHFIASLVIGQAMSLDVLGGEDAPQFGWLRMRIDDASTYAEMEDVESNALVDSLRKLLERLGAAGPTAADALKLGELCAITHAVLFS